MELMTPKLKSGQFLSMRDKEGVLVAILTVTASNKNGFKARVTTDMGGSISYEGSEAERIKIEKNKHPLFRRVRMVEMLNGLTAPAP